MGPSILYWSLLAKCNPTERWSFQGYWGTIHLDTRNRIRCTLSHYCVLVDITCGNLIFSLHRYILAMLPDEVMSSIVRSIQPLAV